MIYVQNKGVSNAALNMKNLPTEIKNLISIKDNLIEAVFSLYEKI